MKSLFKTAVICLAAVLASVTVYTVAAQEKTTATPEQKAEFTAKVAAVAMSKAEVIPAKTSDVVRITSVNLMFGETPEETRVFVAWQKGTIVAGKFVAQTNDNVTLPYADVKGLEVAKFVDTVTAIAKAKGKF